MLTACAHVSRPVTPRECVVCIYEATDSAMIPVCRACPSGQALLETVPPVLFAALPSLRAPQRAQRSPVPALARPKPGPERDPRLDTLAALVVRLMPIGGRGTLGLKFVRVCWSTSGEDISLEDLADLCAQLGLTISTKRKGYPMIEINARALALAKEAA